MLLCIESTTLNTVMGFFDGVSFIWRSDTDNFPIKKNLHDFLVHGLKECCIELSAFTEIVLDVGPGGLISTRSGICFANGLAFSLGIPIIPVNSLFLMSFHEMAQSYEKIVCARKSNEGHFFMGFFNKNTCIKFTRSIPYEALVEMGWWKEKCIWIGLCPFEWKHEKKLDSMMIVNDPNPDLQMFSSAIGSNEYNDILKVKSALPIGQD